MGNKKSGRRQTAQPPLSRVKSLPLYWLSNPSCIYSPISVPNQQSKIVFLPIKAPLPKEICEKVSIEWSISDFIEQMKKMFLEKSIENPQIMAVNVSNSYESSIDSEWKEYNVDFSRIQIKKEYNKTLVDTFCTSIDEKLNKIKENETLICIVYCGSGLNRSGFFIASVLVNKFGLSLKDALKMCDESCPRIIYKQKYYDALCEVFKEEEPIKSQGIPEWMKNNDKIGPIGEIPLTLEKFNLFTKISNKDITMEERAEAFNILYEAIDDENWLNPKDFPTQNVSYWDENSLDEVRSSPYYCTFKPRGANCFLVVSHDGKVYAIDQSKNISLLKVKSKNIGKAVVSCIFVEEKKSKIVFLLTDLLLFEDKNICKLSLDERLAYLSNEFVLEKSENKDQCNIQFVFRPMAKVENASKLRRDLNSFFVQSDGLAFYNTHDLPGKELFLPIQPSVILQFEYNGNYKAALYARDGVLVGVYKLPNSKYNGMDGRTNRFSYDINKKEWVAVALGNWDLPSTMEEVQEMIRFQTGGYQIDEIFKQLDKISYE